MYPHQNKGIAAGLLAGVLWGTPFIAPLVLPGFTSLEITFGRFAFFGLVSMVSLPKAIKLLKSLSFLDIIKIFILSAAGFWLYTIFLFAGVKIANGIIASLIIGCLPITITLFSKPKFNPILICGLCMIIIGISCLLLVPLLLSNNVDSLKGIKLSGVILLVCALLMWTWYGIANSRFMMNHQQIKSIEYTSLIGIINLVCMLPLFIGLKGYTNLLHHDGLLSFIIWSAILGLGASWIANIFWSYSAKSCPPSIGGALIVSETIFGLIYSFIFEQRLPYINEFIAIILLISGVCLVINSQRKVRIFNT